MNLETEISRWSKMPAQLRAGEVRGIARKLGLGQRRVCVWMAHEAQRAKRPGYEQWSYPRDVTILALLDMAGVSGTMGALPVATGGTQQRRVSRDLITLIPHENDR